MSSGDGSAMFCHASWDGAAKLSMPAASPASNSEKMTCAFSESHLVMLGHIDEPNWILRALTDVQKHENQHFLELLKTRMHYVGYAELAAAVSNAGGLGTANEPSNLHHLPLWTYVVFLFKCEITNSCNFLVYFRMFTCFLVYSCLSSAGFGHACAVPLPKDSKRCNAFPPWRYTWYLCIHINYYILLYILYIHTILNYHHYYILFVNIQRV